ncbi:MAG: hypothetical protein R6U78_07195 [Bacteroidales bacterium]
MGTAELRKEVQNYIEKADDRFLRMVYALKREYEEKEEDYTLPGPPMDVETYRRRIKEASEQVKAGDYITQEDLEKEMEQW